MPAPSPGLKRVPRWRTMISPPVTVWPANTLTPRRLAFESRPLRDEPRPFLCAIAGLLGRFGCGNRLRCRGAALGADGDLGHLDPRQLLPVARPPLVAALGLELDDAQLRAPLVGEDPSRDGDVRGRRAV